jgi:perosamine synthetase
MEIDDFVGFVRSLYPGLASIPLHQPTFGESEKRYVADCIDSTFVSSVGKYVTQFEGMLAAFTGASHAVAVSNGTSGLHLALHALGVGPGDQVLTQALTFVATCNAIRLCGANPVFVDVDRNTLGMHPARLEEYLSRFARLDGNICVDIQTGKRIAAVVPMHTLGHPCDIGAIQDICRRWNLPCVEDAAESLGSFVGSRHTGTFGNVGVLSFNGNKTITTGGGGALITNDSNLASRLKHLSTTAKIPHAWEFYHDSMAFNYRMPNINAALGCAQLEKLPALLEAKRTLAKAYHSYGVAKGLDFVDEPSGTRANFWLNALVLRDRASRDVFLEGTNGRGVMTRPFWTLMSRLPMYAACRCDDLAVSTFLADRVVNVPSWPPGG